nr:cobalamin biosynthesis central domain-containing protein [Halorhodospira abdelmalekii]
MIVPLRFADSLPNRPTSTTPQQDLDRLEGLEGRITRYPRGALAPLIAARFQAGCALICCLSVGAVVRLIAPQLRDKATDPAVIAIDESARFVVPVVGGHRGGANALAAWAAAQLDAQAVITTASDSAGLPAVDLLGSTQGWRVVASPDALRRAAAAMVNGEPLALIEEDAVWQPSHVPPAHLIRVRSWQAIDPHNYAALLWVTASGVGIDPEIDSRLVIYRPADSPSKSSKRGQIY